MSSNPKIEDALREAIILRPDVILDDKDVMRALIAANDRIMGGNIVDMRGLAMDRLETRLDRLEDTHRSVIAAAYENLAGTNQIHRAVLRLLDPEDFDSFLRDLENGVAETLRVDAIRLVLEADADAQARIAAHAGTVLRLEHPGFIDSYLTQHRGGPARQVTLRQVETASEALYGKTAPWVNSEACLKLSFGKGKAQGLLLLGSEDHNMFGPQQGTDLLVFFAGVAERVLQRWLS